MIQPAEIGLEIYLSYKQIIYNLYFDSHVGRSAMLLEVRKAVTERNIRNLQSVDKKLKDLIFVVSGYILKIGILMLQFIFIK